MLSDSAVLIRALESEDQPFEISSIVRGINIMRAKFSNCSFSKVSRTEVAPAHALAVAARLDSL